MGWKIIKDNPPKDYEDVIFSDGKGFFIGWTSGDSIMQVGDEYEFYRNCYRCLRGEDSEIGADWCYCGQQKEEIPLYWMKIPKIELKDS